MILQARSYFLDTPGQPLGRRGWSVSAPGAGEVVVEVLACGLCHTDLGFASGAVPTRHELPLILGHEVVGTVVQAGEGFESLVGRRVIVPAVLPCGECELCRMGRGNACAEQKMPGNDIHGGFGTHLVVPGAPLVPLDPSIPQDKLAALSVVADAVSTAYQAVVRAQLESGDAALIVGAGGVGGFIAQIARAQGARVLCLDRDPERLRLAADHGAEATLEVGEKEPKALRREAQGVLKEWAVPSHRWRIFEASGSPLGQVLAFALLGRAATLVQVGYTEKTVEVRLSNLMAFDATVHGTWGCPPEAYGEVLRLVAEGAIDLDPFVGYGPMSNLNRYLDDMAHHRLGRRMVLDPLA